MSSDRERRPMTRGHHAVFAAARPTGAAPIDVRMSVTVVCRRHPAHSHVHAEVLRSFAEQPVHRRAAWSDDEFERVFGAEPGELDRIASFARKYHLAVTHVDRRTRLVSLEGDRSALEHAFGVELALFDVGGHVRRGHAVPLQVPAELEGVIEAVLGLDDLPVVRRPLAALAGGGAGRGHTPQDLIQYYAFPSGYGDGEVIGLLEMAGGFDPADIHAYFRQLDMDPPAVTATGPNRPASQQMMKELVGWLNGMRGRPAGDLDQAHWTFETTMDIEIVGAFASKARIRVQFASANDSNGAVTALRHLLHSTPRPNIMSLSWALGTLGEVQTATGAERDPKAAHKDVYQLFEDTFHEAMVLGVTTCCASGDYGSRGGEASGGPLQVDYPAASRYVLACGGTTVRWQGGKPAGQSVWNARTAGIHFASGGGLATAGAASGGPPSWQQKALSAWAARDGRQLDLGTVTRGVPDVAGAADFATGCRLLVAGTETTAGGTSASAPLWAALLARVNASLRAKGGKRVGFVNPSLYDPTVAGTFTSIDEGTNSMGGPDGPYRAVPGTWDPCTGLGTPNGEKLLAALQSLYGR